MTSEDLIELINAFNAKKFASFAALRVLSDTVVLGYVWIHSPTGQSWNESSYKFYFILDDHRCIGVVFEMGTFDLHWLVLEEHRKRGHLHQALHNYIFPHMFSDGREEQFASADSNDGADYAIRQGFEELPEPGPRGNTRLRLDRAKVDISKCPVGTNQPLTGDEIKLLKARLRTAKAMIRSVSEELLCRYGADYLDLDGLADEVDNAATDLTDINDHPKIKLA